MPRVNVIYHQFPHYRAPVLRELARSRQNKYTFWASIEDHDGIKAFKGDGEVKIRRLSFQTRGKRWLLKGYWPAVTDKQADALLIIGNPNMPATWLMAVVGRALGKRVLFWGHGWLKHEGWARQFARNLYLGLANKVLVYGERAKTLALRQGFSPRVVSVIYNSLDFDRAQRELTVIGREGAGQRPQQLFAEPDLPLIICTARLTPLCQFDLLFEAAAILRDKGRPINILLVGDGPERAKLEELAAKLKLNVLFFGACYEEERLARMIYSADLTVSPGKIGLTAIHSLTYGTPAITHDNLAEQMPEVEAIKPGETGELFKQGSSVELARTIRDWLTSGRDREEVRRACWAEVVQHWTPARQRELIDTAIGEAVGKGA